MFTKFEIIIDLNTQHCNKELENIKKTPSKISNAISEIQQKAHTRRNKNSRLTIQKNTYVIWKIEYWKSPSQKSRKENNLKNESTLRDG